MNFHTSQKNLLTWINLNFLILFLFFLLQLVLPEIAISATPLILKKAATKYELGPHLDILEDKEGKWTLNDIKSKTLNEKWIINKKRIPNFGFSSSAFWIHFKIKNETADSKSWFLELGYPLMDRIDLFIQYNEKKTETHTGRLLSFKERIYSHRNFVFPINIAHGEKINCLMRFEANDVMMIPLNIWERNAFLKKDRSDQIVLGIFCGIMIIMACYNLFLFVFIEDISYLYYVLFVTFLLLFILSENGAGYEYLWSKSPSFYQWSSPFFASLMTVCFLQMIRSFLLIKTTLPLLHKALLLLVAVDLMFIVATPFVNVKISSTSILILAALSVILSMVIAIIAFLRKNRTARFILIGFLSLWVLFFIYFLQIFGILPGNIIETHGLFIGSSLLVLLFSLALTDKYNILKKEKEIAQAKVIKEIEKSKNELEKRVHERTVDLQIALEKTKFKEQEIAHINQVVQAVNSTLDFDEVACSVMDALKGIFKFDAMAIFLIDGTQQQLAMHRIYGDIVHETHIDQYKKNNISLTDKDSINTYVIEKREPFYFTDLTSNTEMLATDRRIWEIIPFLSGLFLPLEVLNEVVGIIGFFSFSENLELTDKDIMRVQQYVSQVATAINNARMAEEAITAKKNIESANKELEKLANIDGLTQIANRRYLDQILKQEWKRAIRAKTALSLILVDIDFFKKYNDHYGHLSGDECLKSVAKELSESVHRPQDLIARFGGEEFIVLLPDTDLDGALTMGEQMRMNVKSLEIPHYHSLAADVVTISVGIANIIPTNDMEPGILIEGADRALYRAKKASRDTCKLCSAEEMFSISKKSK